MQNVELSLSDLAVLINGLNIYIDLLCEENDLTDEELAVENKDLFDLGDKLFAAYIAENSNAKPS